MREVFNKLKSAIRLLCLMTMFVQAHAQVTVSVLVKPPYSSHLSDYKHLENKAVITLTNTTGASLQVKIGGSLTNESAGLFIRTTNDYTPSSPVLIGPYATVTLVANASAMRFLDDANVTTNVGAELKQTILRTGLLPEGVYQLCVDAYDYNTSAPLSTPGAGCFSFNISLAQPPVVTYPANGQAIPETQKAVNFSWTPAMGNLAGGALVYDLIVTEVMPGQNHNDAVNTAREYKAGNPPIYRTNLKTQLYVRQPSDLPLVPGHTYAVQVVARDANKKLSFLNEGRSEVVVFTYMKENNGGGVVPIVPQTRSNDKGGRGFTPKNAPLSMLEKYSFKGKLVWGFRKSEDNKILFGSINNGAQPTFTNLGFESTAEGIMSLTGGSAAGGSGTGAANVHSISNGGGVGTVGVMGSGAVSGGFYGAGGTVGIAGKKDVSHFYEDEANEKQGTIDVLVSDEKYPLAFTKVTMVKVLRPEFVEEMNKQPDLKPFGEKNSLPGEVIVGTTTTDANGNFKLDYYGDLGIAYFLQMRVDKKHFDFADAVLPIKSKTYGTYDLGTITGLANTYRLKINAQDPSGKPITKAVVQVLRTGKFYTVDKEHGNLVRELQHQPGNTMARSKSKGTSYGIQPEYEVAATGKPGDLFHKAFYNSDYADRYIVSITGDGFEEFMDDLAVEGENTAQDPGVLLVEKTYTITLADPMVKGKLVAKSGGVPVKDATVIVHPAEEDYASSLQYGHAWSDKTDKNGNFTIEHIPGSDNKYHITVLHQGKPYEDAEAGDFFLPSKGAVVYKDPLEIDVALIVVCGNVTDEHNKPLKGAVLHWETGGQNFLSGNGGSFTTAQAQGKHVLIAQMVGYKDTKITIDVQPPSISGNTEPLGGSQQGVITFTGTVDKNNIPGMAGVGQSGGQSHGSAIGASLAGMGYANYSNGVSGGQALFQDVVSGGNLFTGSSSCGHTIVMKGFYMKVTVTDAGTGALIPGAGVHIEGGNTFHTGTNGVAVIEGVPLGSSKLITEGPSGSFYATAQNTVSVTGKSDTTKQQITLKAGSKASGTVMSGGKPAAGAEVYIVTSGTQYITTKADNKGVYTLSGISAGEYSIRAAQSGFLADTKQFTFIANQTATINFDLKDPGFNATSLLGFKLTLTDSKPGANANEFTISGTLSGLPDNDVFKITGGKDLKLAFTGKTIVKSGNIIYPKDEEMSLDAPEMALSFLGNYKGSLKGGSLLKLRQKGGDKTKGEIVGEVVFDLQNSFAALSNWKMPAGSMKLKHNDVTKIGAISSDGVAPATSFGLSGATTGWSVYDVGFSPDLASSLIDATSLRFKGTLSLSGVPGVDNISLAAGEVKIGPGGNVQSVDLVLDPAPEITLGGTWKMKLSTAQLDKFGLTLGGDVTVPVPSSEAASLGVSGLVVSKNGISGGNFHLPEQGFDVFGVTRFKTENPLSIAPLAGGSDFKITGSGGFKLPQYIPIDIPLDNFSIATNGDFSASSAKGIQTEFADLAALEIKDITIANAEFGLDCHLTLQLSKLGVGVDGKIRYSKGSVNVDKLHTDFAIMDEIKLSADLDFLDNGFSGAGALSLMGTTGITLAFHYKKLDNGVDVGAQFTAPDQLTVPIGLATWDKITGGFNFNTDQNIYSINAGGRISLLSTGTLLALTETNITITSAPPGPILDMSASLTVLDNWVVGNAHANIDFGQKFFHCTGTFGSSFNLIKGIGCSADGQVTVSASAASDKYIFVSGGTNIMIPHVCTTYVYVVGGWNAPVSADPSLANVPPIALYQNRIYGGYFNAHSSVGISQADAPAIGFKGIAYLKAWCNNESDLMVYGNVKTPAYGFSYGQNWSAGAEADFIGFNIASASITLGGNLDASYNGDWAIAGHLNGDINAHIGCDGGCNSVTWGCCFDPCFWSSCPMCICPCGVKVCGKAGMTITYTTGAGFDFDTEFL